MQGFEVLRKLADGSAAEVFLAKDPTSSDRVILEVIRPELTTDMEVYGRFLDEAKDRKGLSHPNLIQRRTTGCGKDGRLFVVTEPILGEHLGSMLAAHGPFSPELVVRIALPLCDALAYLHERGLVHGNLRPSNVFLQGPSSAPVPKLLDTGLTLFRSGKSIALPANVTLVAPEYLAPERIRGQRASPLSDLYGMGVLCYELLTGRPPFQGPDAKETRRRHLECEPSALPTRAQCLMPVIQRCLAKSTSRRYRTPGELKAALVLALRGGDLGSSAVRTPPSGPTEPPSGPSAVRTPSTTEPSAAPSGAFTPSQPSASGALRTTNGGSRQEPRSQAPSDLRPGAAQPAGASAPSPRGGVTSTSAGASSHRGPGSNPPRPPLRREAEPPIVAGTLVADDLVTTEPVGEIIGSYELLETLGRGGMGHVYLARHTRLERRVALKVLKAELAKDPSQLQRFFTEARAVNRINHEHIVEVHDFVEEPAEQGGRVYFVMEALSGANLRQLVRRGHLPVGRAVHVVRQVCDALEAAHRVGVVHRDIKPDNIFLVPKASDRDFVKVLDFGVAKLRGGDGEAVDQTRAGMVVGTPTYMAPEQALGEVVDARADIYAAGTVLFAILAGRPPFEGSSLGQLVAKLVTQPAPPLPPNAACGEEVPRELAEVVARCLKKRPSDRYGSMAELSEALAPFDAGPTTAGTPPRGLEPSRATPSRTALPSGGLARHTPAATPQASGEDESPSGLPATRALRPPRPSESTPGASPPRPAAMTAAAPSGVRPSASVLPTVRQRPRRRPLPMFAVAAAVGLALVLGGLWLSRRGPGAEEVAAQPPPAPPELPMAAPAPAQAPAGPVPKGPPSPKPPLRKRR